MMLMRIATFLLLAICIQIISGHGWGHGANRRKGYIYMITDLHYDPTYLTTQESCNQPIDPSDLGAFGNVECDPPWELVESAVQAMADFPHDPEMIFWLGDNAHHPKSGTPLDTNKVAESLTNCTQLIKDTFPDTEVFPIMGNHDFFPTSQLPGTTNVIYNNTAELWRDWLRDDEAIETFQKSSYYTLKSRRNRKIRIVALNTNLYYKFNGVNTNEEDPGEQFAWARQVLRNARRCREKVQLLTHIPTGMLETDAGVNWIPEAFNEKLNDLYRDFGDIIVGLHSAHEHMDGFRMVYDEAGNPQAVMLIAPSVTPWRARVTPTIIKQARNPALRVLQYNRRNGEITDIEQYYVDLTKANEEGAANWELEYTFSDAYDLTWRGVNAASMDDVLYRMQSPFPEGSLDNEHVFNRYYEYNAVKVNHPSVPEVCGCDCKKGHICSIKYIDFPDYYKCLDVYNSCN